MNWTGGRLQRHSHKHATNPAVKVQKQHFARARQSLQCPQRDKSPVKLDLFGGIVVGGKRKHRRDENEDEEAEAENEGPSVFHQDVQPKAMHRRSILPAIGSLGRNVASPLDQIRQNLLAREDWVGLSVARPLKKQFPSAAERDAIGKRRRLTTEERARGVTHRRGPSHDFAWKGKNRRERGDGASDMDTLDGLSIRIGGNIHSSQHTAQHSVRDATLVNSLDGSHVQSRSRADGLDSARNMSSEAMLLDRMERRAPLRLDVSFSDVQNPRDEYYLVEEDEYSDCHDGNDVHSTARSISSQAQETQSLYHGITHSSNPLKESSEQSTEWPPSVEGSRQYGGSMQDPPDTSTLELRMSHFHEQQVPISEISASIQADLYSPTRAPYNLTRSCKSTPTPPYLSQSRPITSQPTSEEVAPISTSSEELTPTLSADLMAGTRICKETARGETQLADESSSNMPASAAVSPRTCHSIHADTPKACTAAREFTSSTPAPTRAMRNMKDVDSDLPRDASIRSTEAASDSDVDFTSSPIEGSAISNALLPETRENGLFTLDEQAATQPNDLPGDENTRHNKIGEDRAWCQPTFGSGPTDEPTLTSANFRGFINQYDDDLRCYKAKVPSRQENRESDNRILDLPLEPNPDCLSSLNVGSVVGNGSHRTIHTSENTHLHTSSSQEYDISPSETDFLSRFSPIEGYIDEELERTSTHENAATAVRNWPSTLSTLGSARGIAGSTTQGSPHNTLYTSSPIKVIGSLAHPEAEFSENVSADLVEDNRDSSSPDPLALTSPTERTHMNDSAQASTPKIFFTRPKPFIGKFSGQPLYIGRVNRSLRVSRASTGKVRGFYRFQQGRDAHPDAFSPQYGRVINSDRVKVEVDDIEDSQNEHGEDEDIEEVD